LSSIAGLTFLGPGTPAPDPSGCCESAAELVDEDSKVMFEVGEKLDSNMFAADGKDAWLTFAARIVAAAVGSLVEGWLLGRASGCIAEAVVEEDDFMYLKVIALASLSCIEVNMDIHPCASCLHAYASYHRYQDHVIIRVAVGQS
jgi:hypothetical protein